MEYNSNSRKNRRKGKPFRESLPKDYPWKVLGWLSEDLSHVLSIDDRTQIASVVRSRDLDQLFDLVQSWGLQRMPDMRDSVATKRAKYQLAALLKKFQFPTKREARLALAKEKFLAGEEQCAWFNREGFSKLSVALESWMVNVFTYARSFMEKLLGYELPSLDVMTERSRHGPGATTDTEHGCVSSYHKFEKWPYRCTAAALRYARLLISSDERWLGALEDDYRCRFGIPKHYILNRQVFWDSVFEVVDGNRIAFVPKDARVERSIAIEPTMNLYLQLGVDGFIRRRLKRWGVDLDSQEKNQKLAFRGSVEQNDPFVTIDLANASNTISVRLCELLLPREWFTHLMNLRSPKGNLNGLTLSYEMISSMGNGFTFALESAIFTSIIIGVMRETNGSINTDDFAVFGDDLIVRQSLADRVIEALSNCGFKINTDKSYLSGPVRESCGTDWFQGKPVRPVFLSDTPHEVDELFSDINRIKRILELRWCIEESKTVQMLSQYIPENFRDCVGPYSDEVFDAYIHSASPQVPYRRCVYKYKRLIRKPIEVEAPKFQFRKLMCDLHPVPLPKPKWDKRLTSSGGRFNVLRRGAYTLSKCYSVSSNWRSEYDELQL